MKVDKKITLIASMLGLVSLTTNNNLTAGPVKLGGDFRLRYEHTDEEGKDKEVNRGRIRLRLGIKAEVTDTVDVGAVLATGSEDPVSTNQTLGSEFTTKEIRLDQAYATWKPIDSLKFIGGKFKDPWFHPADFYKSELIWDEDLRPEGLAANYQAGPFFVDAGYFIVQESGSPANVTLYGAQGGYKGELGFGELLIGTGIHRFDTVKGKNVNDFTYNADEGGDSFGNKLDANGNFVSGFVPWNIFAGLGFKAFNLPAKVYGEYVINTDAEPLVVNGVETVGKEETGWIAGVEVGHTKEPLSWEARFSWRDVERDAVFGTFADSDFNGGGTGGKGLELNAGLQLTKGWQGALTYFHDKNNFGDERDFDRLQVDLKYKF
jgi:hypothetical protein